MRLNLRLATGSSSIGWLTGSHKFTSWHSIFTKMVLGDNLGATLYLLPIAISITWHLHVFSYIQVVYKLLHAIFA